MKLLRYGPAGAEKPGMLDGDGKIRDLSGVIDDIAGKVLSPQGLAMLRGLDPKALPLVSGNPRLGPCVGSIGNVVAIGLNYVDHAKEVGAPIPKEPIIFCKHTSSVCGPNDDTIIPLESDKLDWECELAFVIGTKARNVSEKDALKHVAGYAVMNDVSERTFQFEGANQWVKGKSCETFGPLGPWLVTADEIPDPQNLDMFLNVNGVSRQKGNTRTMIFSVAKIISYVSRKMTLLPGDVVPTGTPPGVGSGFKPPVFLKAGDEVHLGIQGLGEQRQKVVSYRD
jgi:2-keto-4-pentenoate hydratase/2-oxohepta-3-ene-1,7-dioic acid hydratase in catechol pathway